MEYAQNTIDPMFGTSFTKFMNIYLKNKYGNQKLNIDEQVFLVDFVGKFLQIVKSRTSFKIRVKGFLNPVRSMSYFMKNANDKL